MESFDEMLMLHAVAFERVPSLPLADRLKLMSLANRLGAASDRYDHAQVDSYRQQIAVFRTSTPGFWEYEQASQQQSAGLKDDTGESRQVKPLPWV